MNAAVFAGRYFVRAIASGLGEIHRDIQVNFFSQPHVRPLHLVTATAGLSKTGSSTQISPKGCYGEDACFIASNKSTDVIGVADGVGGWRSYGVDPGEFSRSLMEVCERIVAEGRFEATQPVQILTDAYQAITERKDSLIGSCTACLVTVDRASSMMHAANLGDSGMLIIRSGQVVHRSQEQVHYFNTPFQMSVAPASLQTVVLSDSPQLADTTSFGVRDGDLILVGTDGLFDNMSDDMILHHTNSLKGNQRSAVRACCERLAHAAHELSFDPDYMSPFAFSAEANGFQDVRGGKPDDITVVLARVTDTVDDT